MGCVVNGPGEAGRLDIGIGRQEATSSSRARWFAWSSEATWSQHSSRGPASRRRGFEAASPPPTVSPLKPPATAAELLAVQGDVNRIAERRPRAKVVKGLPKPTGQPTADSEEGASMAAVFPGG
jgi:hypothetical protein